MRKGKEERKKKAQQPFRKKIYLEMKKVVRYMLHVNMKESESIRSLADTPMHTHAHPCTRGVRF